MPADTPGAPLAIVVAEDSLRDREFVQTALGEFALTLTDNGASALRLLQTQPNAHLLTDLQMPGLNGIELARALWRSNPDARILFWTQHADEMYLRALARIVPAETVYGYVLKDNGAAVLSHAATLVFREQQCWIDPKVRPVQARAVRRTDGLTDAEYAVLVDIALGLTDALIAERHYLSRRGAQSRLKGLYEKLGVDADAGTEPFNSRARAIACALRRGLLNRFELEAEERRLQQWLQTRTP